MFPIGFWDKYGKSLLSVLVAVLVVVKASLEDGISEQEWVQIAIAGTGAVLTYVIPLAPQFKWGKTIANAVLAGLLVLVQAVLGGLSEGEWILVALAVASALGVAVAPAASESAGMLVVAPAGSDGGPTPGLGERLLTDHEPVPPLTTPRSTRRRPTAGSGLPVDPGAPPPIPPSSADLGGAAPEGTRRPKKSGRRLGDDV